MDITSLSLPLRKDRPDTNIFSVRPSITSVNVSYETAAGNLRYDGSDDENESARPDSIKSHNSSRNEAKKEHETKLDEPIAIEELKIEDNAKSHEAAKNTELADAESRQPKPSKEASQSTPTLNSRSRINSDSSMHSNDSSTGSTHEFPKKEQSPRRSTTTSATTSAAATSTPGEDSKSSPSKPVTRQNRAHSSFSVASVECQQFVNSLKEPKYAKPLTADEISWIFQDFYMKLRSEILGPEDELLTREEQEARKQAESEIDLVLDKAEKAVTGGDLYGKLLALGGNHDSLLQPRINAIREHPELLVELASKLEIADTGASEEDLSVAINYLNRLSRETSPKAKLAVLSKAHHAIVEALPKNNSGDADSILPLFVLALTKSTATDWWQNFMFIQRFRRASELVGQAAYCLTNLEACIRVLEQFTTDTVPEGVDPSILAKPIVNPRAPRQRSSSQSSKGSSSNSATATASFSQRLGDTLSSYRSLFAAPRRNPPPAQAPYIDQRLILAEADSLTLADVRHLLREYKRLAEYIDPERSPAVNIDGRP